MNDQLAPAKAKFTKLGVRYRLVATSKSRWSEGKVHLQFWTRDWKQWVLACRPNVPFGSAYNTYDVDDLDTPITCKTCAKKDPR